jgi:uncharacterized membrane protein
MFATPEALATLVAPWAKFYSHSKVATTIVTFLHIAPIVIGGGFGIAFDRATLRLRHEEPGARERHLAELHAVHPYVIGGLVLSFASGVAMLAADLDTFLGSWVFWTKMGLIALLLVNGAIMMRVETALRAMATGDGDASLPLVADSWGRLRVVSISSVVLWIVITFAGVVLANLS